MQCPQPQSTHLLYIAVYHSAVPEYPSPASADLRYLDDGASVCLVLFFNPAAFQTHGHQHRFQALGHWIDRVAGGAMLLLGIKVLVSRTS